MFQKLESVAAHYQKIARQLSDPSVIGNRDRYRTLSQEYAELSPIMEKYEAFQKVDIQIKENRQLLKEADDDLEELILEELETLEQRQEELEQALKILLLPKDPFDQKNVILEIRAGTGGEEAALFAADLFRMYSRFAELQGWRVEILSRSETALNGLKEIIALIEGDRVYSRLKYESGVHRVQRVPSTETQGRIHTSAVTVAVLPEAEEVDVDIDPQELRIDVFRSSGPGGQHVNTTDSAVRITHLPTGLVVSCQDEKSQHKNKAKAMKVLRARLLDLATEQQQSEISETRKSMVGTGDRSERIRTYNFPQGRMSDHRIGLTLYKLEFILEGNLEEIIEPLQTHFQSEALRAEAVGT